MKLEELEKLLKAPSEYLSECGNSNYCRIAEAGLIEKLLAVAKAAKDARSRNHIQGWEGKCKCEVCKALADLERE